MCLFGSFFFSLFLAIETWREGAVGGIGAVLVEETVALLGAQKLLADDALGRGPQLGAADGCFGQTADVQIDVVHRLVRLGQSLDILCRDACENSDVKLRGSSSKKGHQRLVPTH